MKRQLLAPSLFTAFCLGLAYVFTYILVLVPRDLDRACTWHTDNLCMAAWDPEGVGYQKSSPLLASLACGVFALSASGVWYVHLAFRKTIIPLCGAQPLIKAPIFSRKRDSK